MDYVFAIVGILFVGLFIVMFQLIKEYRDQNKELHNRLMSRSLGEFSTFNKEVEYEARVISRSDREEWEIEQSQKRQQI